MKLSRRGPAPRRPTLRRTLLTCLGLVLLVAAAVPFAGHAARRNGAGQTGVSDRPRKVGAAEFVPGEALVRFRSEAKAAGAQASGARLELGGGAAALARISNFKGSEIVPGLRLARFEAADTLAAISALNARADVLYAEPNYIWRTRAVPNDARYAEQYSMPKINAPAAWDTTTGSAGVVVAVIDEGVDLAHPDLAANAWTNPGETPNNGVDDDANGFVDDIHGWDFANNNNTTFDAADGDDHGTHVAGTIGARGNNGVGVAGVNWQVGIMSVKVLGAGGGTTSNIISGYNYVLQMKQRGVNVRVTNNSYGGPEFSQSAFDAISALGGAGILFAVSAGNDARDNFNYREFPANYNLPNVLPVASTTSADTLSSFSNFGSRVVGIGAPGSSVLSTTPGNTYSFYSGTSMAAPHVAGAAALLLSAAPGLSVAQLRGALAYTGDRVGALESNTTTGRRLNVRAALDAALEADSVAPAQAALTVASQAGRSLTLSFAAPGDDGFAGTAADYDFYFVNPALNERVLMPTSAAPAAGGAQQSVTLNTPYRSLSGTVEMVAYDNRGNASTSSVAVAVAQSATTDPYTMTPSAAEPLSTGGTRLALDGDDVLSTLQTLPFALPFYGQQRTGLTVSSNGALYFATVPRLDDGGAGDFYSAVDAMQGQTMIAGAWDDLVINTSQRPDAGVYVVQPAANRLIYRWQATTYPTALPGGGNRGINLVNFEIELRSDGTIVLRYGAANQNLFPVAGISGGEPSAYVVASHTSKSSLLSLTNAQAVTFAPRGGAPPPPPSGNCGTPTPIGFGQTASGTLASGDCQLPLDSSYYDAYTFTGAAGQLVTVTLNSTAFDPYLYLLRPGETTPGYRTIQTDDIDSGNLNSRLMVVLPESGTYTILANSASAGQTGPYQLSLLGGNCAATTIGGSSTVNGALAATDCQLSDGSFVDVYAFSATAGQQVSVSMSSSAVDPYLFLLSTDGFTELARNDDGLTGGTGGNFGARIPAPPSGPGAGLATLPAAGTYYVLANSFSAGETGAYQLTLTLGANCPTQVIGNNQPTSGQTLATTDCRIPFDGSYVDVFTFGGFAGQQVAITMTSAAFDSYLLLYDPAGYLIAEDNNGAGGTNARIPAGSGHFTLPATGTYRIYANAASPGLTGAYELVVTAVAPQLSIASVVPAAGRASGGQQVKLTGSFTGLSSVAFGGSPASWSYTNGTSEITVTTPPHAPGAVDITLVGAAAGSFHTKPNAFAYLPTAFTDDQLVAGATTAKAQHVLELRQAVDALRAVAGLPAAQWTDATLPPAAAFIKAVHITELRARLEEAAAALGLAPSAYTDPGLGAGGVIRRVHVEELRQRVRNIAG